MIGTRTKELGTIINNGKEEKFMMTNVLHECDCQCGCTRKTWFTSCYSCKVGEHS